ncbi:MAG TPA: alanine racemase [Gemmatimonadaceae bacterium]|nr:alanine racemase [Gemmatimonadaceae bacterium]
MHALNARAWVDVDLGALLQNGTAYAARAGVPLLPMVKADAYGLGAVPVARALERLDPWGFGVATVVEGEELRQAGVTRPIVVFTPLLVDDLGPAAKAGLTPTLGARDTIVRWRETGRPWQLAIDTGMSRAGIQWNDIGSIADLVAAFPPEGAFTHFHSADAADESRATQEERFTRAIATLPAPVRPAMLHAENSAAVERRGKSPWTVARPGIFLYGVGIGVESGLTPCHVATVRARVVDLRVIEDGETVSYGATYRAMGRRRIATLGIGYADGYRRILGNRAVALVGGRRAPVIGVVTMDMTMLDVTDVPCETGDVATLIGRDGDEEITISDVARFGGLSPYEVLTGLRGRLPRRYIGAGAE